MSAPGRADAGAATEPGRVSAWIERWSRLVPTGGRVLDVACGAGRHARWFAMRGCHVTAVDRDPSVLHRVRDGLPAGIAGRIVLLQADLERADWPFDPQTPAGRFDAVVVTNYLWRPLLPTLVATVAPGGSLLYETFSAEQAAIGRPTCADFLLTPGELLRATAALRTVAYEHGLLQEPTRWVQRIAAVSAPASQPLI